MAAKAYVLLRTAPGLTKSIYSALQISPAVTSVEMITGPYDLIVAIEAATTNEILTTDHGATSARRPGSGIR